jgi:hypothetical protein
VKAARITAGPWDFEVGIGTGLLDRFRDWPVTLRDVAARIGQGIRTSANEVYVLDFVKETADVTTAESKILGREVRLERAAVALFLQGREIKRYRILPSRKVVIVPYGVQNGRAVLMPETEIRHRFPLLHRYLTENKEYLAAREKGRFRGPDWFQYGRQQNIDLMLLPKILVPDIADRASFAWDEDGSYAFTSGYGITLQADVRESPKYVLALLNSSLLDFLLKRVSTPMRGGFFRYFTQFISQLPIRRIDFSKTTEVALHDRVVAMADTLLALHMRLTGARSSSDKGPIERQIDSTTAALDRLVYELYGLTEEERGIVEGEQ